MRLPPGPIPDWVTAPLMPTDLRGWNEDWRVGDLAQCVVKGGWAEPLPDDPKFGDILRVNHMIEGVDLTGTSVVSALGFEGKPGRTFWACRAFRKLRPMIDPAEDEFIADLTTRLKQGELA